ncbi:MAG TPA: hypothetical protein P5256_19305 [Beijerinckiaceae bacterium]|nr:hypothetical protein [Rhodoblastus sp.]HRY05289.1 hypothetical protein [Beijerinckiaceae bacterium]
MLFVLKVALGIVLGLAIVVGAIFFAVMRPSKARRSSAGSNFDADYDLLSSSMRVGPSDPSGASDGGGAS